MDEPAVPNRNEDRALFQQMMSQFGGPAFLRRAQRAEAALRDLRARLAQTRCDWLEMVRLRLGVLLALAGSWEGLEPLLSAASSALLQELYAQLQPRLRAAVERSTKTALLRAALVELAESLERFNRRWLAHLHEIDLSEVNRRRDEYNRYYLLEKECAVRSVRIARQGFRRLEPITTADVLAWFPSLPTLDGCA